jgi:hypothetical protein
MRSMRWAALSVAPVLPLAFSAQADAAKSQSNTVAQTSAPIWSLAMDGSRVAYASGGKIHVWNAATGKTSVVQGRYSNATHTVNASQIAIAGKRVAWIKDQRFGNTEEGEKLYLAPVGGKARQVMNVYRYGVDDSSHTTGGWIEGLVGSGSSLAVSTWRSDGTTASDQQLSLVTAGGLSALAGGSGALVSQAVDSGHIADLSSNPWAASPSASIYTTGGAPLSQFSLAAAEEIALSGHQLAVLTTSPTPTIQIYDWRTGTLEHSWPAEGATTATSGPHQVGHVEAYGGLVLYSVYTGYIGGYETLHVLDPATGNDAVVAHVEGFGANREWAIGSRGLVYTVNSGAYVKSAHGKLVFVPTTKLAKLVG